MGGKQKQSQRTKGNVRPSSSARAAELLATSGTSGGFVGFTALSGDLGYVPASGQTTDQSDASVDPDFRLVLRKLSKKDPTTKLKALQELSVLCQEKEPDNVKTVLPFWPRIYTKVSIDSDRRVREASHNALGSMAESVGRELAPHLRCLMGAWLLGQCDPHAPSATAAKKAFCNAFPSAKQTEALTFCKEDAFLYLQDNLLTQTAQTLSDPQTSDLEEMESKFLRVTASSLSALSLLLSSLADRSESFVVAKFGELLDKGKVWKLAKQENNQIRAAFYSLLSGIIQQSATLRERHADQISSLVLYNIDETEPLVCGPVWQCLLLIITNIQDCWTRVNPRKGVWPKLWKLLQRGGNGMATTIYPNLLPLLGNLPKDISGPDDKFYDLFFTNMRKGLCEEHVLRSSSEVAAIVTAHMECIRLLLSQSLSQPSHLYPTLITDEVRMLVEAALSDKNPAIHSSCVYDQLVEVITFLVRASTDSSSTKQDTASYALSQIIDSLNSLTTQYIEQDSQNSYTVQRFAVFIQAFKSPQHTSKRSHKGVQFLDSVTTSDSPTDPVKPSAPLKYPTPVMDFIYRTLHSSYIHSKQLTSPPHLSLFSGILHDFISEDLLRNIIDESTTDELTEAFVKKFIEPWMRLYDKDTHERSVAQDLVTVCMAVYNYADDKDKCLLLSTAIKVVDDTSLLYAIFSAVLSSVTTPLVRRWFRGGEFGRCMVHITSCLCEESLGSGTSPSDPLKPGDPLRPGDPMGPTDPTGPSEQNMGSLDNESSWDLLNLAMSTHQDSELVLGESYLTNILSSLQSALPTDLSLYNSQQVHRCVAFICRVALNFFSNIKGCLVIPSTEKLLLSVFQLDCHECALPDAVKEQVSRTWQLGLKAFIHQMDGVTPQNIGGVTLDEEGPLSQMISHLRNQVGTISTMDRLQNLTSVAVTLTSIVEQGQSSEGHRNKSCSVVGHLYERPLLSSFTDQWKIPSILRGELIIDDLAEVSGVTDFSRVPNCVSSVAFISSVLVAMEMNCQPQSDADLLIDIIQARVICRSMVGQQKQVHEDSELVRVMVMIDDNFSQLTACWSEENLSVLVAELLTRGMERGGVLSLCLSLVTEDIKSRQFSVNWSQLGALSTDRYSDLTPGSLATLQVIAGDLPPSDVVHLADIQAAQILSLPADPDTLCSSTGCVGHLALFTDLVLYCQDCPGGGVSPGGVVSSEVITGVLTQVETWRHQQEELFLFASRVREHDWTVVRFNMAVCRFLCSVVRCAPTTLSSSQWDFILCSLLSWVQSCSESQSDLLSDLSTQAFACMTFDLLTQVHQCMEEELPVRKAEFPDNLASEWAEFFSEGAFSLVLPIFVQIAASVPSELTPSQDYLLAHLSQAASLSSPLFPHQLLPKLVAGEDTRLPDEYQTLLNHLCPLLISEHRAVQVAVWRILLRVVDKLPEFEEAGGQLEEDEEESRQPAHALLSSLETAGEVVEYVLRETPLGGHQRVEERDEGHALCRSYLLCWNLLLRTFNAASSQLRAKYAHYLISQHYVDGLMVNVFRLMPASPATFLKDPTASSQALSVTSLFSGPPQLDVLEHSVCGELQRVACSVYFQALRDLPAIIRQYWTNQDKHTARIIEEFTSKHASPILSGNEIRSIQDTNMDNMKVRGRPAAREVLATYTVESVTMELVVVLPSNYPLGPITVETGKRIGVTANQWRNWMLQLTTFLHNQNGSILDGLALWKKNVDKLFAGAEECMICFSVIHGSTCQMPKLQCRTCKKKYHSACLYKWFSTSNKSTCPLCRSVF